MDRVLSEVPLIVPAAGQSHRFRLRTARPKGLLKFRFLDHYRTMIEHCVDDWPGPVYVACRKDDEEEFSKTLTDYSIVPITESHGQAHTVAQVATRFNGPFVVLNSDNAFRPYHAMETFVKTALVVDAVASCMTFITGTFDDAGPAKYGYVDGHPTFADGAEKVRISRFALAGAFCFRDAQEFADAEEKAREHVGIGPTELPLSAAFVWLPQKKLSHVIPRSFLHEWGTPDDLLNDPDVRHIDWEG